MDIKKESLKKHYEWGGKIEVCARASVKDSESLSLAYTPGVAEPSVTTAMRFERLVKVKDLL